MKKISPSKAWLAARFAIFPIAALLPFILVRLGDPTCFQAANEMGIRAEPAPVIYGVINITIVIMFLVFSFMRSGSRQFTIQRAHVLGQFFVSLVSVAVTVPTYLLMRSYSQNVDMTGYSCDSNGHLHGASQEALFGLGISPSTLLIMAIIYLTLPVAMLYITHISKKHVAGIKKKDLFQ